MIDDFIVKNLIKTLNRALSAGNKEKAREVYERLEKIYSEQPNTDLGFQLFYTLRAYEEQTL